MDLAEFLLARIAEDEGRARTGAPFMTWETVDEDDYSFSGPNGDAWHSARCGYGMLEMGGPCSCSVPARVLAEAEAKRRIVELIKYPCDGPHYEVLQEMGTMYADHPDYQPEWKP